MNRAAGTHQFLIQKSLLRMCSPQRKRGSDSPHRLPIGGCDLGQRFGVAQNRVARNLQTSHHFRDCLIRSYELPKDGIGCP
jgi:hypothetical protein